MCLDVYDGTTSFTRVMKTDLNGGLIWTFDYYLALNDTPPVLRPFSITTNVGGDGYVICGVRDNDSYDTLSNDLTPFTLEIDENGNVIRMRTYYHSVTPGDLSAVPLKIVATPQGNYAMTGFQGYEFGSLSSLPARRGFLHIIDANLNTVDYRAFHGFYSGYLWSNCKWDMFGEVISFIPDGQQNEVYFVAGAVTDSVGRLNCGTNQWGIGLLFDNALNLIWQSTAVRGSTFIAADYDLETNSIFVSLSTSPAIGGHCMVLDIDFNTGVIERWDPFEPGTPTNSTEFAAIEYPFNSIKVKGDTLLLFGYSINYTTIVGISTPYLRDTSYIPVFFKVDKYDFTNVFESWLYKEENAPILLLDCDYSKLLGMFYMRYYNKPIETPCICGTRFCDPITNAINPLVYAPKSFVDFNGAICFLSYHINTPTNYVIKLKTSYPSEVCSKKNKLYTQTEYMDTNYINDIHIFPDYWDELTPDPNYRIPLFDLSDCDPPGPIPFNEETDILKSETFTITTKNGQIEIQSPIPSGEQYNISLFNSIGQIIYNEVIPLGNPLNLEYLLPNRVYYIRISKENKPNESTLIKFVK
jgi:hypothetical protein